MSGHSKWKTIKHKKSKMDDQRGKIFTKLIKEITTSARIGGGDENANPRLRQAIIQARNLNMPMANVDRAIKKGTGELPGVTYEEYAYEGYGPGGAALLIEVLTDNKNRSVSELRHTLSRYNGSLAEAGSVAWMFNKKGQIIVDGYTGDEDKLMEIVLESGADDMTRDDNTYEVITAPELLERVKNALEKAQIPTSSAEIAMIPKTTIKIEGKDAEAMLKLMEAIEDLDDVQNVNSNFDIDLNQIPVDR
jgi:YebC/PmpR family DNA-binding regulatory protein